MLRSIIVAFFQKDQSKLSYLKNIMYEIRTSTLRQVVASNGTQINMCDNEALKSAMCDRVKGY